MRFNGGLRAFVAANLAIWTLLIWVSFGGAQMSMTGVGTQGGAPGCDTTPVTVTATGAGSFTQRALCNHITVEAWGGGGSGEGASTPVSNGGCGGGYSKAVNLALSPGNPAFYTVGIGGVGSLSAGGAGGQSWANVIANAAPTAGQGAIGGGGGAPPGTATPCTPGTGTIGTVNFTGGSPPGSFPGGIGGGGGAGASSISNGNNGSGNSGGAATAPDGGKGGDGGNVGSSSCGVGPGPTQPGGATGGSWSTSAAGTGCPGQVRLTPST